MQNLQFLIPLGAGGTGAKPAIPHSSFLIPHSSFLIPHSSFLIPHSSFFIPHFDRGPVS